MEKEVNTRRIPTGEGVMDDKKFNDLIYAYLQTISHRVPNKQERYVWKNNFRQSEVAKRLGMNLRTFKRKFANLKQQGYVVDGGDVYNLPSVSKWCFFIPLETLEYLVDTANEKVISTYAYLGELKNEVGDNAYFTKSRLLILLGYKTLKNINGKTVEVASTNKKDWDKINNILQCLCNNGLLQYREVKEMYNGKYIYKNYYEIKTRVKTYNM